MAEKWYVCYCEPGKALALAEEIADDWERQTITNVAERLYSKRKEER